MRTYTHGVIGYLLYAKRPRHEQRLAIMGGILPDVFLALGFVAHALENLTHSAMAAAFHALLHHSTLHTVTVAMHSFVIVGPCLALSAMLYRPALPFFVGMFAHGIVDFLTHREWAYNHLFHLPFALIQGQSVYRCGIYHCGACTATALCGVVGAEPKVHLIGDGFMGGAGGGGLPELFDDSFEARL
jgi:hypothetical protein